ncbi:hypothetical protein PgNI_10147 [Pyricularia grisea]|uniref:Uncharacterized protein n=1 Tax=Pyricularia grisea TaxID=148305 RepID=A0A6P8AY99_PYRGI|nr:hypothetical protein PgNI_10147 [Pyricularia grisea]TLD07315.1 hypothetical protein PgNI_10147 [Pyricularia grisea]
MTSHGVKTRGHLWKLGCVVDTADFPPNLPWIKNPTELLICMNGKLCYNYDVAYVGKLWSTFTEKDFYNMVLELAAAILARWELMLSNLWNNPWQYSYRAVFFFLPSPPLSFAFTSVMQGQTGLQKHDANGFDYNTFFTSIFEV